MVSWRSLSPLPSSQWPSLPHKPGVYLYTDAAGKLLYVGKAKDLRQRVSSYFHSPVKLGAKTALLVSQIKFIRYFEVGSEIEALLLESRLINNFKPPFNIISKDDKSPYYIHLTQEPYPKPVINHDPVHPLSGPFLNSYIPRKILRQFRRIAPYCLAPRPVRRPCLYSHLGLCSPCPGAGDSPAAKKVYAGNVRRLKRLFAGHFAAVSRALDRHMQMLSKAHQYEQAGKVRDQLVALEYLLSQPVLPDEYLTNPNLQQDKRRENLTSLINVFTPYFTCATLNRIEVYDQAHLRGANATGAMVVALNGEPDHKLYRHFLIRTAQSDNDVAMLTEVLTRRLSRSDWPVPDLIVVDGGIPQLAAIRHLNFPCPVVSLAKRREEIIIPLPNGDYRSLFLPLTHPGLRLLQTLRDEAHRFCRRLHHTRRSQQLFS